MIMMSLAMFAIAISTMTGYRTMRMHASQAIPVGRLTVTPMAMVMVVEMIPKTLTMITTA